MRVRVKVTVSMSRRVNVRDRERVSRMMCNVVCELCGVWCVVSDMHVMSGLLCVVYTVWYYM